jgi:hypothetical protein
MNTKCACNFRLKLFNVLLLGALMAGCVSCQSFSLSEEDWQKQERGEIVDQETGEVVETVGTAGYYGAMVGKAVASALKK